MKHPKVTLLTCTHNGEKTIQQVLEAIANQTDISKDIFEILIVDNASTDCTSEIADATIKNLHLNGKVLSEPRIGKVNAFLTGVYEAKGEIISIIDDDNLIETGFISHTLAVFEKYPKVGVVGSSNRIFVDTVIPNWFKWIEGRYACSATPLLENIQVTSEDGVIIAETGVIAGAGLSFRVEPLKRCLEKGYHFFNDGQRGEKMKVSGEDTELCWLLRSLGYLFAYDPRIKLNHAIKPERLDIKYFKTLCATIGAGCLGFDPFLFTHKYTDKNLPLKWTWQWQLISKIKRYITFIFSPENVGESQDEKKFRNWIARIECMAAIKRILHERSNYTKHIHQVACGEWTDLRVR
ncbi:MAG: glycosyltransferase family 2 protein [Nostocales cyanobacterium]|nr:MAG: glycosyltransferase family 2 protein [Nostocales cyanobacterium]